jgi:hypothetical protein
MDTCRSRPCVNCACRGDDADWCRWMSHVSGALIRMEQQHGQSNRQGIVFAALAMVLLGLGMLFYELRWQAGPGKYLESGALSEAQKESITVTLELFQLLMTWALAVVGATGFFLKLNVEKALPLRQIDLLLSLAIIILSVLSLYFGHLGIDRTAELLSLYQYPVNNEGLRQIGRLQYLSFFAAVMLFGFHIFQFFWRRILSGSQETSDRG